ncbi:MAG TPA: hypothetical protein PLK55_03330 [archaeon]|jgi:hypothetical protein|nr:hypothetical protein [archaeon]
MDMLMMAIKNMNALIIVISAFVFIFIFIYFARSGFGKGKSKIKLYKTEYNYGETISGKLIVNAKKQFVAESIDVSIVLERKKGDLTSFRKDITLEKNITFNVGDNKEFEFKIDLPSFDSPKISGRNLNSKVWKIKSQVKISNFVVLYDSKNIKVR